MILPAFHLICLDILEYRKLVFIAFPSKSTSFFNIPFSRYPSWPAELILASGTGMPWLYAAFDKSTTNFCPPSPHIPWINQATRPSFLSGLETVLCLVFAKMAFPPLWKVACRPFHSRLSLRWDCLAQWSAICLQMRWQWHQVSRETETCTRGQSISGVNAAWCVAPKALRHISGRRAEGGPHGAQVLFGQGHMVPQLFFLPAGRAHHQDRGPQNQGATAEQRRPSH